MFLSRFLLAACLVSSTCQAGLLAHWKLDSSPNEETAEFPATWEGASAYTNTVSAPVSTAGATLAGAWLNAGNGFNFERTQAFSASAWIKGGQQDSSIVGDMTQGEGFKGWELHVGTDAYGTDPHSVTVWLINDYPAICIQVNALANVLDNQWHQIGFSYDGSSSSAGVKIYIDGVLAPSTALFNTLAASIANGTEAELEIGTRSHGAIHNFTGSIDEVAIFDHALTAAEMSSVRNGGVESVFFPIIKETVPLAGQSVTTLTTADVAFSYPVTGVDAADLLVNGVAAASVSATDAKHYRFSFPAPPQGDVHFTWAAGHGIAGANGVAAQPAGWSARFVPVLPAGQVIISEFLSKNAGGQEDEDHDTPDWIELVNPGTASVNLAGWALTDDPSKPRRYVLPSVTLSPGGRKLVFASGKNRAVASGTLHADFKLADEGGYLALSDPSGNLVHVYDSYPRQEGNVSFGLLSSGKPSDGRAGWRYQIPTPNTVQSGAGYSAAALFDMVSTPAVPAAGEAITVTIRTSPEAVLTVPPVLYYKVMYGLDVPVNFADDGLHGDGAANDRQWGAVIPAGVATAGQMVRWRASMTSSSVASRWPINTSASAFLPVYEGTVIGGSPGGQVMPVYQVFVQGYTFPTSTSQTGIDSDAGARGAFYGNGKLYDNVLIRIKGTTSRYLMKRSHRVDFNPGCDFEWSANYPAQRELNLNSEYNDPSYLRQNQQLWMHRDSGNAGSLHFPVKVLMNGTAWQLAFHSYSADSELVETMGLDPRGALYKQVGTLSTGAGGEKKSRKWESTDDYTAFKNGIASSVANSAKLTYILDNTNIPALINYLAVARLAQEGDDVWANMTIYRDSDGTKEWRPIPFDLNLSFGQLFYGGQGDNTTVHADHDNNKSHPLYGSISCPTAYGSSGYNRLYDAVIQNTLTRAMLLRRIRTLMDRYLMTTAAVSPLEANFDSMGALINSEATADRARWGLPPNSGAYGLGPNISPSQGLATLKSNFLQVRRTHFYTTHSVSNTGKAIGIANANNAGIPVAQVANPVMNFGTVEARPANGNPSQAYIQLNNPGSDAVDISGWTLRGASGLFKMKGGTVIPPNGSVYVSPNVVAFRARTVSPKALENRFVVGPYSSPFSPYGETLRLENAAGTLVAQATVPPEPNIPAVSLAVTEIMSSSAHTDGNINGDWWELTNTGASGVALSGFSWDDNHFISGKAVFPSRAIAAGESIIILNEDDSSEAADFRIAWNLPASVQILTREDFGLTDLEGLGNGDSVAVYLPNGTQAARSDFPSHSAGKSRAWHRNGVAISGGYSVVAKYGAVKSNQTPFDIGSPGYAAADPATLTDPYQIWAAANDVWANPNDPTAAQGADPDNDGRSNRSEYIFGGSPRVADGPLPQSMVNAGGDIEWTFTRRSGDPAVIYQLQSSDNLVLWQVITPTLVGEVPDPVLSGYVRSTYRITPGPGAKFLRATGR